MATSEWWGTPRPGERAEERGREAMAPRRADVKRIAAVGSVEKNERDLEA